MRFTGVALSILAGALVVAAQSLDGYGAHPSLPQKATARPFEHSRHEALECRECHGTGEQHRTMLVRTPRDCASCHHDAQRGFACSACHAARSLPEERAITNVLTLSVWDSARARVLPFGHERHARIACAECHQTPVTLARSRDCSSCHARHDQPDPDCASCHVADAAAKHQAEAHLSCAGSGCHATTATFPAKTRNACLACHAQQSTHEPGGDCAACHRIPAPAAAVAAAARGGRR